MTDIKVVKTPEEFLKAIDEGHKKILWVDSGLGVCWRNMEKECVLSKCCYDAGCQAIFDYWKFANSAKWKKMIAEELKKQATMKSAYKQIEDIFYQHGFKGMPEFIQILEQIKEILP